MKRHHPRLAVANERSGNGGGSVDRKDQVVTSMKSLESWLQHVSSTDV